MTDPAARESGVALLPCPFCGGKAAVREDDNKFCIVCISDDYECWCSLGEQYDGSAMPDHTFYTEEAATEKWNTRAALSTAEGSGAVAWRDIASAPKDGTRILAWPVWSDDLPAEVRWRDMKRTPGRWETGSGPVYDAPTHWMPLPASPSPSASEGE